MADHVDTGLLPRTYFRAPRVPFDFRALAIAILGYLVYWAGGLLVSEILGKEDVPGAFLGAAFEIFREIPFLGPVIGDFLTGVFRVDMRDALGGDYTFWHKLVGGAWFFVIWSFFGQAIHRITSLRIARDEGLSLAEAFRFSAKNWITVLLAPVIVMVAIGIFYVCNLVAGAAIAIPFFGSILSLVLVPLTVLSTLLILLIAVGGIFGLPLIGAAAAWERNGSLDAISRAFSYLFARPLQFFWNYFLIFLFVGVILLVGSWFISVLVTSVDSGVWSDRLSVAIDAPERDNSEGSDWSALSTEAKKDVDANEEKSGIRAGSGTPFAKDFSAVAQAPWSQKLSVLVFWAMINLIWLGVFGYAVYWFLGASTSVYADLRADVDGTEEDEIYLEEEEEEFDALAEAAAAAEEGPVAEAGASAEPASGGADAEAAGGEDAASGDDEGASGDEEGDASESDETDSGGDGEDEAKA